MANRPRITLYVDIVSPFVYEAYYVLRNSIVFQSCDVRYVPVFLGGLMKSCGNTPPIFIKNKDKWIAAERLRWARAFAVPMKEQPLPKFPPKTLTAMRALAVVALEDDQQHLTSLLDELFRMIWVEHCDIENIDVLQGALQSVLGKQAAEDVTERAATTEGKNLLAINTTEAFKAGAFGLPWMVCTNTIGQTEGFWGVDRIGQVAQFLNLDMNLGVWASLL